MVAAQVLRLYKTILRLHRGLPEDLQTLGDNYVKAEFKRHKQCSPAEANVFLQEWTTYAITLTQQITQSLKKQSEEKFGRELDRGALEAMRDEQIYQLYELKLAATKRPDAADN